MAAPAWAVSLLLAAIATPAHALDISQCIAPLGMGSGQIPNSDISGSSSFDDGNVGPQNGRLNAELLGGAWCPRFQITKETSEWLQVDLHMTHVLSAVGTQGRFGNGQGREYAEAYVLEYWRPSLGKWVRYRSAAGEEVFTGNSNTYLEKKNRLDPPIWASKLRFLPYSSHLRTVCMRVEVYGCLWSEGIMSYTVRKGDKRANGVELVDSGYDGQWGDEMSRGLGQLVDGHYGGEELRESSGRSAWVGWRSDAGPLLITVEFERVREFSAVHLYCNNRFERDIQVFSEAIVTFSVGGKHYQPEPVRYSFVEDRIFESARNVSINLHRRIGKWVRIELRFAAKWILLSEIIFESDVAQGNYSTETQNRGTSERPRTGADPPVSTARPDDPVYMAVVVGVLTALVILLAVAIFLLVNRHRHRKCFASPLAKSAVSDKRPDSESYSRCGTSSHVSTLPPNKLSDKLGNEYTLDIKSDDYQEPYQALKCAPYFSYSTVQLEMKDLVKGSNTALSDGSNYDYAVPELGSVPLLNERMTLPDRFADRLADRLSDRTADRLSDRIGDRLSDRGMDRSSDGGRMSLGGSSRSRLGSRSPSHQDALSDLKRRLESTNVIEFPRHRLRMISKLAEGAFGTVYVAEADGVPEYNGAVTSEKRLVAVKFLSNDATPNERAEFERDVRILAALSSPRLARVLGACRSPPLAVVLEYLEQGDLRAYLRAAPPPAAPALLHMAVQIAAGMRYLESLNFVHRDLAARNCLVGKGYQVKISDFGTDNEAYACDYYKVDGRLPLPIRWAAWESVLLGKYTTKSDVWSFAVTLDEILTLCRRRPYESMTESEVIDNLAHLQADDGAFECLPRAATCARDIYDLMSECWRRDDLDRPTFREIHLFLQRKNLGYAGT